MFGIDSYTLNKVAGWVLGTALLVFGLNELSHVVYHAETPEEPGMIVEVAEQTPAVEETAEGDGPQLATLLAAADPAAGESAARACQACHTLEQGGAHRVGPNLWDVVGRPIASAEGYQYSDALQARSGETWTYEALSEFVQNPRGAVPGTKMAYGGMQRDEQRADLLVYLRTLSEEPEPLPAAEPEQEAQTQEAGGQADAAQQPAQPAEQSAQQQTQQQPAQQQPAHQQPAEQPADQPAGDAGGIAELVAAADPEQGQAASRVCQACHTLEEGGAHRVGPNLWGVVGRPIASAEGYQYSDALQGMSGDTWTLDNLNEFIMNPRGFAPGTKMAYGGMRRDEQRADLLAYLQSIGGEGAAQ